MGSRLTVKDLAVLSGVTYSTADRVVSKNGLRGSDRLVDAADFAKALAAHRATPKRLEQPDVRDANAAPRPADAVAGINEARLTKIRADAERARLRTERDAGRLVDARDVAALGAEIVAGARLRLEALAPHLAPKVAGLDDVAKIERIVAAEVKAVLADLTRLASVVEEAA